MSRIEVANLMEGRPNQPNEVCLTMYFEESQTSLTTQIIDLIQPEVGFWERKDAFTIPASNGSSSVAQEAYKALEPPEQFQSIFLFFIRPNLTTKTLAVQLIISVLHQPKEGWALASTWLHHAWLQLQGIQQENHLGYSIIYQATIDYDQEETPTIGQGILTNLWCIHTNLPNSRSGVIASQRVSKAGWLWLVTYPDTHQEGIIYLVLGRNDKSNHLASESFATRNSLLCSLDAFTHKALRQGLELMAHYDEYEQSRVLPLQRAVRQLLRNETSPDGLENMVNRIIPYTEFCWAIERLAYSLKQQISGINRLYLTETIPSVASQHLLRVRAYEEEGQAILDKNKDTLKVAQTALSMAEAVETKRANRKQERFNLLITFVGTFLAADSILDSEFAKEFLTIIHSKLYPVSLIKLPVKHPQPEGIPYWCIFWSRIVSAFSLTGIIFGIGWLIRQTTKSKVSKKGGDH